MYFSCCQILFFSFWDLTLDSIFCVSDLLPLSMVYQHSQPHISLIMFSHNNLIVAICFQNSFVPSFLQTYQLKTTVKLSWQTQMQIHMSMIPPLLFFFFCVWCTVLVLRSLPIWRQFLSGFWEMDRVWKCHSSCYTVCGNTMEKKKMGWAFKGAMELCCPCSVGVFMLPNIRPLSVWILATP